MSKCRKNVHIPKKSASNIRKITEFKTFKKVLLRFYIDSISLNKGLDILKARTLPVSSLILDSKESLSEKHLLL